MANILAFANGAWNVGATWTGGSVPGPGDNAYLNNKTISIDGDITCDLISNAAENGATAGGTLTLAIDAVTITADIRSATVDVLTVTADVDLDVVGDLYGGTTNGVQAIVWNGPGTLTITGTIVPGTGGTTASAVNVTHASCTVNIIGDLTGSATTAVPPVSLTSTGTVNITGNITGGSFASAKGFESTGGGYVNVTGNVLGGPASATSGLNIAGNSTVVITGDVTGGAGGFGILINAVSANLTVNGDVFGGTANAVYGIQNTSSGTVTVDGTSTGSEQGAAGIYNNSSGIVNLYKAKGNTYGPGGAASVVGYGVVNYGSTGTVTVEVAEYGPNGMIPTLGPTKFKNVVTTKCIVVTSAGSKTLSDPNDVDGLVPVESDVRAGTVYAGGVNTGTLAVPDPGSVSAGTPTDDTVGTAVLTVPALSSVVGQLLADALTA